MVHRVHGLLGGQTIWRGGNKAPMLVYIYTAIKTNCSVVNSFVKRDTIVSPAHLKIPFTYPPGQVAFLSFKLANVYLLLLQLCLHPRAHENAQEAGRNSGAS